MEPDGVLKTLGEGLRPHARFLLILAGAILAMILLPSDHAVHGLALVGFGMIAERFAANLDPDAEDEA